MTTQTKATAGTEIRRGDTRGFADHGWLRSFHSFSFADYHHPERMGFGALRVINEDRVAAGQGFGTHGHENMEILSYVLDGELAHRDSLGTGAVIRPGELQRMSAGTGVRHSEFNSSQTDPVHFLQIWILPDRRGHAPGYEQKAFPVEGRRGKLQLLASPDGAEGSVTIHQDARVWTTIPEEEVVYTVPAGRKAWVQVVRGAISVDGERLEAGDAAVVSDAGALHLGGKGEALIFDLA